jgi:hypothetical protein
LLIIGDSLPNLQDVFKQKKSGQMQRTVGGAKRSEMGFVGRSRGQTPNQSPRQQENDSFNLDIADNKSTATYGQTKVVRKAKTREELAQLRKQMMKTKFKDSQQKRTEFTLGAMPEDGMARSQMDTTSQNALSTKGKMNQDSISYINLASTFGNSKGQQLIMADTDLQGQKTEKK